VRLPNDCPRAKCMSHEGAFGRIRALFATK
jgi:hypothetical protein